LLVLTERSILFGEGLVGDDVGDTGSLEIFGQGAALGGVQAGEGVGELCLNLGGHDGRRRGGLIGSAYRHVDLFHLPEDDAEDDEEQDETESCRDTGETGMLRLHRIF
jgi:hypothetical protein